MSGVTCRYLFIFFLHLSVADNLFSVAPFKFEKLWRDVCGWDQTAAAHMHHSFWQEMSVGGNMSIFTCRDLCAREWPFILMKVFSQSRTSGLWLWQSGCDKLLVSATEVINEGLVHSVAVTALTTRLVA